MGPVWVRLVIGRTTACVTRARRKRDVSVTGFGYIGTYVLYVRTSRILLGTSDIYCLLVVIELAQKEGWLKDSERKETMLRKKWSCDSSSRLLWQGDCIIRRHTYLILLLLHMWMSYHVTHQGKTRGLHVILYDGQTYLDTVTSGLRELTGNMVAKYEPELLSFTLFLHFARPHIRQTCARDGRVSREPDVDLSRIRETL